MPSPVLVDIFIQMLMQLLHVIGFLIKYQDRNTKKKWQVFSRRAKDYGKSLLGNREVQEALSELDKLTNREVLIRMAETHEKVNHIDAMQMDEQSKKWLSPPDVSQYHNTINKSQQKAKNSILWIYGKPGSGKSVLW
ncbi:hypothetical protein GYMLUDRAFT_382273 [Collybiopsis luxurians FD-317 M1]|nr:hypothetical protein GYMLUDRAFT_382273 [Collybiopsis luxurians FD-317 M1]